MQIKTIVKSREQMRCSLCNNNTYVLKLINEEGLCLKCFYKKYPQYNPVNKPFRPNKKRRKLFKKLSPEQIAQIRKNISDYRKSIGRISIIYGGCFK